MSEPGARRRSQWNATLTASVLPAKVGRVELQGVVAITLVVTTVPAVKSGTVELVEGLDRHPSRRRSEA